MATVGIARGWGAVGIRNRIPPRVRQWSGAHGQCPLAPIDRGHGALVGVVHHANQAQEFLLLWSVASRDEKGSDLLA